MSGGNLDNMGLLIRLERENGDVLAEVQDPQDFIWRHLPEGDDKLLKLLGYIDPYGNTVFNRLQMPDLLQEWREVMIKDAQPDEINLLKAIESMAVKCEIGPHLYLKFYGD